MTDNDKARQRFIEILEATGRENINYVIEDLDSWGHRATMLIQEVSSTIR